jgi:hypothetical protein
MSPGFIIHARRLQASKSVSTVLYGLLSFMAYL